MKNTFTTSLLFLGFAALTLTVCAEEERFGTVNEPGANTQNVPPMSGTAQKLNGYTFERRAEFAAFVTALSAQSDITIQELTANFNEMQASRDQREVVTFLKTAQADFKDKVTAVDNVALETWETTKANVTSAWVRYEQAVQKARTLRI